MQMSVESTRINFLRYLLGTYDNRHQAYSNPTKFSYIHIQLREEGDGIVSKSWYHYEGHKNPYRVNYHKVNVISDSEVNLECYDSNWSHRTGCDAVFKLQGKHWVASVPGKCMVRNALLDSYVRLTGDRYECYDAGRNTKGDIVWGGTDIYIFKRTGD